MEAAVTSAAVSNAAFKETVRFSGVMGIFRHEVEKAAADRRVDVDRRLAALKPLLAQITEQTRRFIRTWHEYLNVSGLHSDGCLRAAFATVSEIHELLAAVCEGTEPISKQVPKIWDKEAQAGLQRMCDQLEDIIENLALLIDDEARSELKGILAEAGLDDRMLERKNAGQGSKPAN